VLSSIVWGERSGAVAPLAARGDRRATKISELPGGIQGPKKKTMLRIG